MEYAGTDFPAMLKLRTHWSAWLCFAGFLRGLQPRCAGLSCNALSDLLRVSTRVSGQVAKLPGMYIQLSAESTKETHKKVGVLNKAD